MVLRNQTLTVINKLHLQIVRIKVNIVNGILFVFYNCEKVHCLVLVQWQKKGNKKRNKK